MSQTPMWITLCVLGVAMILFILDRIRMDLVAMGALLALSLTGVLTPPEALAGFSDAVVVMIAALFVVGEGLFQTGLARTMGKWPAKLAGTGQARLVVVLMLMVAAMSAFLSSTGTVAVLLPVALGLAADRGLSPSRLLMPLSVASLLGGMWTLVGTPPNLVVSAQLEATGRPPFAFFAFAPVGLLATMLGVAWLVFFGRKLLPDRIPPATSTSGADAVSRAVLLARYGLNDRIFALRIPTNSPLVGRTLRELDIRRRNAITVIDMRFAAPGGDTRWSGPLRKATEQPRPVLPDAQFSPGLIVRVLGRPEHVQRFAEEYTLIKLDTTGDTDLPREVGFAEVLLTPRSRLVDHTVEEVAFREKWRVTVLAVRRMGAVVPGAVGSVRLRFGDTLLVKGPWDRIALLTAERRDFVVISDSPEAKRALRPEHRAPIAGLILLLTMLALTLKLVPAVIAVLCGALAMILSGCVPITDTYRAVSWPSVVLVAAMLPMATALQKTGALDLAVASIGDALQGTSVRMALAAFFVLTSLLSQVISNTATAVLISPMAIKVAAALGVPPEPLLIVVAIAASTAFSTPMASPVNTLVAGPGGYTFLDFLRVGVPLQGAVGILTVLLVPMIYV